MDTKIPEEFIKELGDLVEKHFKISEMTFDEDISEAFLQIYHASCKVTKRSFFIQPPPPPTVVKLDIK